MLGSTMHQPPVPFLRDPATVSRRERIEHYRTQAARYEQIASQEDGIFVREGLLALAKECEAMADSLGAHGAT